MAASTSAAVMPSLSKGLRTLRSAAGAHSNLPFIPLRRDYGSQNDIFRVSEEVRDALHNGKPVVALETTIYTHGTSLLPGISTLLMDIRLSLS